MTLPQSYWPKKKLGSLSPTNTVTEYEWYYFSIPRGVSTVAMPVGMEEFTPKEIREMPRDPEVVDLLKAIAGGGPLPVR